MTLSPVGARQEFVVPNWMPANVANLRLHWAAARKAHHAARDTAWTSARYAGWQPVVGRARLTITFTFPRKYGRGVDQDNATARCKGLIDGLVKGGWLVDDSTEYMELVVQTEIRPRVKETRVVLEQLG